MFACSIKHLKVFKAEALLPMQSHKRPHELSDILLKNICFPLLITSNCQLTTGSKAAHITVAAFVVKRSFR